MSKANRELRPTSDRDLDRLAKITPTDVDNAARAWRQDAPAQYKTLLDATTDKETERGQ